MLHDNRTVKLMLWSSFSRMLMQRIKHFRYNLAEISFFNQFDKNLVQSMTSLFGQFAYSENSNISGTKSDI